MLEDIQYTVATKYRQTTPICVITPTLFLAPERFCIHSVMQRHLHVSDPSLINFNFLCSSSGSMRGALTVLCVL